MKKAGLLARIEMLERRVASLEARPVIYPPVNVPSVFQPSWPVVPYVISVTDNGLHGTRTIPGTCFS